MIGAALAALTLAGILYQVLAAAMAGRSGGSGLIPVNAPAVSVLKPLYGAEPRLEANLATFLAQDYPGAVQIVCGVARADDAAVAAVAKLRAVHPEADIALVVDGARHGGNAKVSNLINMMAAAKHDVLIASDSDIAVAPDYLARVIAGLTAPGVGAVSCLYHGRGDAGWWSALAAMQVSYGFLPAVMLSRGLGAAEPCMGSTIALRRETLERIGGFAAFADTLADDYAIGEAVRGLGLQVAVPGFTVAHACADDSLNVLAAHELRWNATVRHLSPWGYSGLGILNPLPVGLIALAAGASPWWLAAALAARIGVKMRVDRLAGVSSGPVRLLPLRDILTFGLFLGGFLVQSVDWRGARLAVADGRITGE